MPDQEDLLDEEQDAADQPDQATDVDDTEELPDDPEVLKAKLKEVTAQSRQKVRAANREAERQKARANENEAGKTHWYREASRLQGVASQPTAKPAANSAQSVNASPTDLKVALKGLDMAEFVADEDGATKFVQALLDRGAIVTPGQAAKMLDDKVNEVQSANQRAVGTYQQLAEEFPDMANRNSTLSKEAYAELEVVATEKPHWTQEEQLVEATRRAARNLEIAPGAKPAIANASANRERLQRAQGGTPSGRQPAGRPAVVTPELQKMAMKTAGGALPADRLAKVAKQVAANQRRARQG